jgi:hypothetical protein
MRKVSSLFFVFLEFIKTAPGLRNEISENMSHFSTLAARRHVDVINSVFFPSLSLSDAFADECTPKS